MKKFYLHDGKEQHGPYDVDELKQKNISPKTPVWSHSLEDWTPAGQIEELKSLFRDAPRDSPPPYRTTRRPDRKLWIITLSIASLIFVAIILFNNRNNQADMEKSDARPVPQNNRLNEQEEKERQRRALESAQQIINREYRNNWNQYITHRTNDFKVGFFGGISKLEVTITNNTEQIIDEVVVQVDYKKENGDVHETKEVVINNIPAGGSKSAKAPETNRGIKVKTQIKRITSKPLSFCFDITKQKDRKRINPQDPWLCR